MNTKQRAIYFKELWPAACAAKGWNVRDDKQRRMQTLRCMELVRGPRVTTSDERFGQDEITALFCYLEHVAHQDDLVRAARWVDCQQDYKAFSRARHADWHERETYGADGSKRLQRDRFGGAKTAEGEPLEPFSPADIKKRHITTASRHRAKLARENGQEMASHGAAGADEAAPTHDPEPAYVPPSDVPF